MAKKFNLTSAIVGAMRRLVPRTDAYKNTLHEARRTQARKNKNGATSKRPEVFYECAYCLQLVKRHQVEIDHVEPVGSAPGTRRNPDGSWDDYIWRLFCDETNLVVACKVCHQEKTRSERERI